MKYILKLLPFVYIIALIIIKNLYSSGELVLIVMSAILVIYSLRIKDTFIITLLTLLLICVGVWYNPIFAILLSLPAYDLSYSRQRGIIFIIPIICILFKSLWTPESLFICSVYVILGYTMGVSDSKQKDYKRKIDDERRLRYELEGTKAKLFRSAQEIAHLAEITERNRIAREIHDNVGHSITGILMRLRLARKLYGKDDNESVEILDSSIEALSETITLLRDTVHNIKPKESLGIEYLKEIIGQYSFCEVDFKVLGDVGHMAPGYLEFVSATVKEALTNASKYSNATKLTITLEVNENIMRLVISDNGRGVHEVKEGMGISGMRERARNMGGTISINSDKGFSIICVIPISETGSNILR